MILISVSRVLIEIPPMEDGLVDIVNACVGGLGKVKFPTLRLFDPDGKVKEVTPEPKFPVITMFDGALT